MRNHLQILYFSFNLEHDVSVASQKLSDSKILHVLSSVTPSYDQNTQTGDNIYENFVLTGHKLNFKDYTNIVLWCNEQCIHDFLYYVS